jgi:beta-1,4-mannosyltransferase
MPYKGAIELALVFTEVTNPNVRLVIAGQAADPEIRRRLCDIATRDRRILLNLQWLTDDELLETTAALDALMLPFNEILHSASIIYGLSCGKVIVTPETAFATDLQHRLGSQWIKTYKKPLSADVLSAIGKPPEHSALDLEFLSINESGLKLQRFYREILGI